MVSVEQERLRSLRELYARDEFGELPESVRRLELHVGQVLRGEQPTWLGLPFTADPALVERRKDAGAHFVEATMKRLWDEPPTYASYARTAIGPSLTGTSSMSATVVPFPAGGGGGVIEAGSVNDERVRRELAKAEMQYVESYRAAVRARTVVSVAVVMLFLLVFFLVGQH